uniref:methionine--tRNA ligase n=1 Tax=Pithovirus LCPAC001 TaxID=2506585 RepID=A0A481Z1C4_9VIRU|nr:MAG: methionyl-tRNA synthetase [Pithovirus LCPAC001]
MSIIITTAIAYTNGPPHIGHLYEYVLADIVNRYFKILGHKHTYYLTGTDEHGQKIANKAKQLKIHPKELCNNISRLFKQLHKNIGSDYNTFIRTTDPQHIKVVQNFFQHIQNDIELGTYQGWYLEREECFITEICALKMNYIDEISGKKLIKLDEESLFFRLDRYYDKIIMYVKGKHIYPIKYRNEIIERLRKPLKKISISRIGVDWGIPVPKNDKHVFYVWFDALLNYISGVKTYRSSIHIIGKDILWFHSVVWIGMLLSAKLPLPEKIFVHGFIVDSSGKKMSKSLGNVVNIDNVLNSIPIHTIRYGLAQSTIGNDVKWGIQHFIQLHNSDLVGGYGNLINRVISLIIKYNFKTKDGTINTNIINKVTNLLNEFKINEIVELSRKYIHQLNSYITMTECWSNNTIFKRDDILQTIYCGVITVTRLLHPVIPQQTQHVLNWFKVNLNLNNNIERGYSSNKKLDLLFNKIL